ncbi:MAG: MATE family efflux transporter [Clostridia bacterium]|nr:MATE family efflux transporter [Clostridia bacterium]
MNKQDLTKGKIFSSILFLALPIMGTSFVQMAYNMTDMIWIGRVGGDAAAAVGTAGFYMWFASGLIFLCRIGAEVLVAQSVGRRDIKEGKAIVQNVLQLILIMGMISSLVLFTFNKPLIGFFGIDDLSVVKMAEDYLKVVSIGLVFFFVNPIFSAIFNGYGKSGVPFAINTIGLAFNIIFDPILIFGVGPFPALGVIGAGIATISAQLIVTLVFILYLYRQKEIHLFEGLHIFNKMNKEKVQRIVKIGLPVGLQSMLFTFIAMIIGRLIAEWGYIAIAVQKVGSQIESISWMTASGFSTATSTFVGQNYGANQFDRIKKGYEVSFAIMAVIGVITSLALIFFAGPIFKIFIPEAKALEAGIVYLKILGFSQFFMCIEIMTNGAFNGLGKTMYPAINSVLFNALRIPMAFVLSKTALDLSGVWWSISISSIFKGIIIVTLFIGILKSVKKELELNEEVA